MSLKEIIAKQYPDIPENILDEFEKRILFDTDMMIAIQKTLDQELFDVERKIFILKNLLKHYQGGR